MASHELQRASDRDRDATAQRLREAATAGRLTMDELGHRLALSFAAVTYGELDTLLDDLPAVAPPTPPSRPALAGWWRRSGAWLIDAVIVGLITGGLSQLLPGGLGLSLGVLVSIGYFTGLEGGPKGGAAGKQVMHIRVVDAETYGPIGYGRAFIRWVAQLASTVVFLLGYVWMLLDIDQQCWHDKLAGDVVVSADAPAPPRALPR